MRIADREELDGAYQRITIVPETVDDLWHLSHVITPGDRVAAMADRRIQRDDELDRDTGGVRETLFIVVAVETVEFARFATRLRTGGEIVHCSREDQIGQHHTLNIEPYGEVSVQKRFHPDQLARLESAEAATDQPEVIVVTVEEGAGYIHEIAAHGATERVSLTRPTGKGEYAQPRAALFEELADAVGRMELDALVLAGPGFTKQEARPHIEDALEGGVTLRMVDTAGVGDRGVHEVLTRGVIDELQAESRIAAEAGLIDEVTRRLSTDGAVSYGPDAVTTAVEYGAVEELLVVDTALQEARHAGGATAGRFNRLLEQVEQQGGSVTVLSGEFDPGRQLANLGGIAALLRFPIS
jgi:protein pelota